MPKYQKGHVFYDDKGIKHICVSCGPKFVTCVQEGTGHWNRVRYSVDDLRQDKDRGHCQILFESEEQFNDHKERNNLKKWFYWILNESSKLSINSLRAMKQAYYNSLTEPATDTGNK